MTEIRENIEYEIVRAIPEIGERFHGKLVTSVKELGPDGSYLVRAIDGTFFFIVLRPVVS